MVALHVHYEEMKKGRWAQEIKVVEVEKGLTWIYKTLDIQTFDITVIGSWEAYVDDEGLLKSGNLVLEYPNGSKLAGDLLVYKGVDEEGGAIYFGDKNDDSLRAAKEYFGRAVAMGVTR